MTRDKIHKCDLQPDDIMIAFTNMEFGEYKWSMSICRTATQQDLEENHYFEEEGDIIWQTVVEILACPYCGEILAEQGASEVEGFGSRKCHSFAG